MFNIPVYVVNNFFNFIFYFCKPYILLILVQIILSFISNYCLFTLLNNSINNLIELYNMPLNTTIFKFIFIKILWLLGIWLIGQVCLVISNFIQAFIYPKIEKNARVSGFNIIQNVPVSYLYTYSDGFLENNITYAADSITSVVQNIFEDILPNILIIIVNLYNIYKYSIHLGILSTFTTLLYLFILFILAKYKLIPYARKYANSSSQRTNTFIESIHNRSLNYIYNLKDLFLQKIDNASKYEEKQFIKSRIWSAIGVFIREQMFFIFQGIAFLMYMLYLTMNNLLNVHNIKELLVLNMAILMSQFFISNVLVDLLERYGEGSQGVLLYKELYSYIINYHDRNRNGLYIENGIQSIEFINVSLSHQNIKILENVSFSIQGGTVLMLSGPSGCGKTTLVNILAGVYTNYTGIITINGINIKEYAPISLLDNIAYIMQGTNLFEGTILSNIILNKENINISNIEKMSQDFNIKNIYKGVGVNGYGLSGGEKQRVYILRGIVALDLKEWPNNKLIIADEIAANLDKENAIIVLNKIKSIAKKNNSIMIIIEHSPFANAYADKSLIFQKRIDSDTYEVIQDVK